VLRSWRTLSGNQDRDVKIDIAVIGAGCSDPFSNASGVNGPSASGSLGLQ
jgi:citrate lyase subunit alpha/citrate CoA-transferase